MPWKCPKCGASGGDPCCGGVSQLRYYQCEGCNSIVPNPKWDRITVIDGAGNIAMKCPQCEESVPFDQWVFTRDSEGLGEYNCPRCGMSWGKSH